MSGNVLLVIDNGLGVDKLAPLIASVGTTARLAIVYHHVSLEQLAKEPRNFYDKAISYSLSSKFHTQELVTQLTGLVKPGSPLEFRWSKLTLGKPWFRHLLLLVLSGVWMISACSSL